jgi:cell division protein FtsQ
VLRSIIASVALLVVFVLVAALSPLLSVDVIRISGNERIPTKELRAALTDQLGRPLPQVSASDVAKDLKEFTLIQSVSVVNMPPHTLEVRIVERQPICVVQTNLGLFLYDPAGVRIGKVANGDNYPQVEASGIPGTSPEFRVAIQALMALPVGLYQRVASVSASSMDSVTFKLRGSAGQKVIWGDSSQAALKARVLSILIEKQNASDRVTFNVSSPKDPTVIY